MHSSNLEQSNCEIKQFLRDVREYFKASLETSEYENSSNLFYVNEAETTIKLMQRCEILLRKFDSNGTAQEQTNIYNPEIVIHDAGTVDITASSNELDAPYLEMTGNCNKKRSVSHEHISSRCEFTNRCSASLADIKDSLKAYAHENFNKEEDSTIYDTFKVSKLSLEPIEIIPSWDDCPFLNFPASYLEKDESVIKYGQLQRVEKRLFFDQNKKCFCGIMNDWLLCYADSTALHPNYFLYLKTKNTKIEHFGEGKRRDVCFQITSGDPINEKIIFQAVNEVDAKEWIHAIESVKNELKQNRRLPTPPTNIKKLTYVSPDDINMAKLLSVADPSHKNDKMLDPNDRIYEEPSFIYNLPPKSDQNLHNNAESKENITTCNENLNLEFYDTPKSPPKPIESIQIIDFNIEIKSETAITNPGHDSNTPMHTDILNTFKKEQTNSATSNDKLLSTFSNECTIVSTNSQKIRQSLLELSEKIDIEAKKKDLHSKLSSQLLSPNPPLDMQDRFRKKAFRKSAYSDSSNDSNESIALTTTLAQKANKNETTTNGSNYDNQKSNPSEKSTKNWFFNRFQKTTSSMRGERAFPTFAKSGQSENENLLNGPDSYEKFASNTTNENNSKVSMMINRIEATGGRKVFTNIFEHNDCNTYEPIMTVSSTPNKFLKKI